SHLQFQNIRLTNNPDQSYTSYNNAKCVGLNGSNVYTVWGDHRDLRYEIYFKTSTDEGLSWGNDIQLTGNTNSSFDPSLAVVGSNIYIAFESNPESKREIFFKRSTDGGLTWEANKRLTNDPAESWHPSIAVSGSVVNVVWFDERDDLGNYEIYYKRST